MHAFMMHFAMKGTDHEQTGINYLKLRTNYVHVQYATW
jgi:hypothetical protein